MLDQTRERLGARFRATRETVEVGKFGKVVRVRAAFMKAVLVGEKHIVDFCFYLSPLTRHLGLGQARGFEIFLRDNSRKVNLDIDSC